jgi:hypothetical protein
MFTARSWYVRGCSLSLISTIEKSRLSGAASVK